MKLKYKIYKERVKISSEYGILELVSQKKKNIAVMFLLNILIWGIVISTLESLIEPHVVTIEVAHANPTMVTAGVEAKQTGVSVNATNGTVEEEARVSSPQPDIESLIRKAFGNEAENAIAVARCESQLNPSRIGDTHMDYYSYGLFQINQTWHKYSKEQLLNPEFNIKIAKKIYDGAGWKRWSCAKILGII